MVTSADAPAAADARITAGLSPADAARVMDALAYATPYYAGHTVRGGQDALEYVVGLAGILTVLETDADTRIAGLLSELMVVAPGAADAIEDRYGRETAELVKGIRQIQRLHQVNFSLDQGRGKNAAQQAAAQMEALRKMLLAMAVDMRVVLVRLGARLTALRYFAEHKLETDQTKAFARQTMDIYAPLANRLGIWQLKWELEDLSFRFLEPVQYKRIAKMLEEKRIEREAFVASAIARLKTELAAAGIQAEVSGRPKHIYSIWNKMRGKTLDFAELYDVRAFRVVVADVKACYAVLGLVHHLWTPIPAEFDDYIAKPKSNGYRSLHTVVADEAGRAFEVQIRTAEMHHFAEYGVAAHWRYKEAGGSNFSAQKYDEKIAWLRQLLAWKNEVTDTVAAHDEEGATPDAQAARRDRAEQINAQLKAATLDDRIYVLTPQARVIELPAGATPVDFAYHLHSDVGHRCRGAKVDGVMVPLNTPLKNGQTVEVITAKGVAAGPSRDWLSPDYAVSSRTRSKIRAWFNAIEMEETITHGRTLVEKTLQREGKTSVNLEELAHKLGFDKTEDLFVAVGKDIFSLRNVEHVLRGEAESADPPDLDESQVARKSRASSVEAGAKSGVLVVGTEGLLTQLAKCCKPAPPDEIVGFVTRGKGVSIHRLSCKNVAEMRAKAPERIIQTAWGSAGAETVYPVDIFVMASDRQGLLRDISEIFLREKINVIGVSTQSMKGQARMAFTAEIASTAQLNKALQVIREVKGVVEARRT